MQISCARTELHEAVQFVAQGVTTKTTIPILSNILIEGQADAIRLVATDHDVWVERTIPSVVGEPGAMTIPARILGDILSGLPEGDVHLTSGERHGITLDCGNSHYDIVGLSAEDFPPTPSLEGDSRFSMRIGLLREMVRQVGIAVSHDDAREALTGILFTCDGSEVRLVATDTHRLALRKTPAANAAGIGDAVNAVIRERAVHMVSRAPARDDEEITVLIDGSRVSLELPGVTLVASLLAGAFPSYDRVIPREHSRAWTLPTEEFTAALRRAQTVAKESSQRVVLSATGQKLTLTAKSEGLGEAREELEIAAEGEDMQIAFNAKYVLDGLGVVGSEGVILEMTEPVRPALLRPALDDPEFLYVVMPMALSQAG
jgi:DNA polymerase-3 subunit beta